MPSEWTACVSWTQMALVLTFLVSASGLKRYFYCSFRECYTNISPSQWWSRIVPLLGPDLDDLRHHNEPKYNIVALGRYWNQSRIRSLARARFNQSKKKELEIISHELIWAGSVKTISVRATCLFAHYQNQHSLNAHWMSIVLRYCLLCGICVLYACEWLRTKTHPLLLIRRVLSLGRKPGLTRGLSRNF